MHRADEHPHEAASLAVATGDAGRPNRAVPTVREIAPGSRVVSRLPVTTRALVLESVLLRRDSSRRDRAAR